MISSISFLLLLVVVLLLVYFDYWPRFHHRRVKNVDLNARRKINQLVEENWQQLLDLAKEVIDCRLADGMIPLVSPYKIVSIYSPLARFA